MIKFINQPCFHHVKSTFIAFISLLVESIIHPLQLFSRWPNTTSFETKVFAPRVVSGLMFVVANMINGNNSFFIQEK